jgi:hypothetical protein
MAGATNLQRSRGRRKLRGKEGGSSRHEK